MMMLMGSVGRNGRNFRADVIFVQRLLNRVLKSPFVPLKVDGLVGRKTIHAIEYFQLHFAHFLRPDGVVDANGKTWCELNRLSGRSVIREASVLLADIDKKTDSKKIAWGAKVSAEFKKKLLEVSRFLDVSPDYLMACIAFETGETFDASIKNFAGSGATGLIQFMPSTARGLGTSTDELSRMSAITQLDYVMRYFSPYKGRLKTLEDVYMAILYPAAVGKPSSHVLFRDGKKTYTQNKGFDANMDGKITLKEISHKVQEKYAKGLQSGYAG